jgi:hypothetical protein
MAGGKRRPGGSGEGGEPGPSAAASPEQRLEAARELMRSAELRGLLADLSALPGIGGVLGAGGDVLQAAVDLVQWAFEPVKYEDFERDKRDAALDGGTSKQGETKAMLPRVTARVESARCLRRGWLSLTILVEADCGQGKDDITEVGVGVLSPRCRGFVANPTHRFASEEEHQSHRFSVEVKCADLILERTTPIDVAVWVELSATDDEGRQRRTRMRLSSPALDDAVSECCV